MHLCIYNFLCIYMYSLNTLGWFAFLLAPPEPPRLFF
nr:MAG TPA: hypothetical protein [Caudoviricetes sp.]